MGFSLKKLLEGATAQVNPFDSGKTFATVVRNQPVQSQPAKTPPPSYGSNPFKQAVNRTRDVFDANTPQDRFKRQLAQKPVIDFTAQDRARQTVNGVKNVAGNYAKGFVESYNQVGTGLGTLLAQNSADVKNAQKAQNNLADQLHQQRMSAIKTAKNPNLNDVQRNRLNNYYNSLDRADVDLQNSRTQQSNDLYSKLDPKKNLAAIGSVGFDIATFGVGTGGTQAVKQAFKSGIKTGAKELGGQMVKTGSLGAVSGGLSPIVQKGDQATAKDILQGAGMGFAMGAALPAVAPAVKFGGSKAVNTVKGLTKENIGAISPRLKLNNQIGAIGRNVNDSVDPLEALKQDARKYKTADEFVKAKTNAYHGTNVKFDSFDPNKLGYSTGANTAKKGFFFTDNTDVARGYGEFANDKPINDLIEAANKAEKAGKWDEASRLTQEYEQLAAQYKEPVVMNTHVKLDNPLVYDAKGKGFLATDKEVSDLIDKAKADGKDGVVIKNLVDNVYTTDKASTHTVVFDPQKIFTSKQLTDLYNQAKGAPIEKTPQPTPDPTAALEQEALKYKSAEEFARQFEYHGGPKNLTDNKIKLEYDKSGGVFTTPDKRYAQIYKDKTTDGAIHQAYVGDKKIIDLTTPEAVNEVKKLVGSKYTLDGEELVFTKDDLDFLFPNGKADWATFSQYIPLLEKNGYKGARFMEHSDFMGGGGLKSTSLFEDTPTLPENFNPTDLYNQAHTQPTPKVEAPTGAPIEKTANLSQEPKQPTISPKKIVKPQQQNKPLGVDGKIVSDLNNAQKQPSKQISQPVLKSPYMNNTLRESAKLDQKNPIIKEYAKMLKQYDDGAVGGQIIGDYSSGYKRITEHSPFYSGYYKMYGRKPSMKAWAEEAERQLKSGKAYDEMQKAFNDYNDPEIKALLSRVPEKELTAVEQNKINADTLKKEVLDFRKGLTPVKQTRSDKNIPVFKLTKDSDVITKTNVNPNIKKGEKRFAIDANGELQPDTNGAYRLFTDEDGKVTSFRIGNKVYGAKDFGDLSQVNDYGSTIATMRRNIERAYKDNPTAKSKVQEFIVDHQQQQATKMIERQVAYRDDMKTIADDLGINFSKGTRKAKQVSADIQNFGEGTIKKQDLVAKYGDDYANKIVNADKWFREQYDLVLNEMNNTLTKYGYDPIPRRSNYYTHFQDENVWKKFGVKMDEVRTLMNGQLQEANPNGVRGAIPSKLAGMSEYLLPNKKFNPYALERKGAKYTPDAFQAFEKYLNPALNNIYMTPSITRTRVLARAIAQNSDLAGTSPSKLIVQMREWANHLAGKTNRIGDRQAADSDWMSNALKLSESIQRKVGQQSIVGNVATAVMQPVVLAQTTAKAGFKNTLLALMQEFPGAPAHSSSAPIRLSSFMKRRYLDTTPVTAGKLDIASKAASTPLTVIEETTGRVTWNSYHNQALEQGLKGKKAINFADTWAEKTMAGRAIGEKPELYRSKSAAFATQFQLEVNNMWQQLGKEFTKKDVARFVVAAYGINMAMQQVTGRQPAFNPLDAAIDSVVEMANSEDSSAEKAKKIGQRWGGEMVMNTPIASQAVGLLMDDARVKKLFGPQTPVGRFGVGSTFRSFGDNTVGKVIDGKPLEAAAYFASPFGYSQAQKSIKGLKAVADGKLTNKDGNTTVEIPQTPKNWVKGGLFGPSAIPEVNAYYNNIGLDKKDQKPVPNQTSSVASRQGQTPLLTREDQLKDAKNSIKYGAGKEWAKLTETEIKQKALDGDEQAKVVYQGMQAMEKVYAPKNIPTKGLNSTAEDILNKDKKITSTGKNAWNSKPNTNQTVKNTLKAWNNGKDVPVTNEVAKQWAEYEKKAAEGTLGKLEAVDEKKKILRNAYNSTLNEDEKDLYKLSKTRLKEAYDQGLITDANIQKALDAENKLYEAGLIDKKSLHGKLGLATGAKTSGRSGRSSRSGRSGGRKSTKKVAKLDLSSFSTYKSKRSSTNASLRKLLGSAKV